MHSLRSIHRYRLTHDQLDRAGVHTQCSVEAQSGGNLIGGTGGSKAFTHGDLLHEILLSFLRARRQGFLADFDQGCLQHLCSDMR